METSVAVVCGYWLKNKAPPKQTACWQAREKSFPCSLIVTLNWVYEPFTQISKKYLHQAFFSTEIRKQLQQKFPKYWVRSKFLELHRTFPWVMTKFLELQHNFLNYAKFTVCFYLHPKFCANLCKKISPAAHIMINNVILCQFSVKSFQNIELEQNILS